MALPLALQTRIVSHPSGFVVTIDFLVLSGEDEMETTDTQLSLLSVVPGLTGSISFTPENMSIVLEDEVVTSGLLRLADAFVVLFGGCCLVL